MTEDTLTEELLGMSAESILDQILANEIEKNELVVSAKNSWNAAYLSKYLKKKYGEEVEIEVLSADEFRSKYSYDPPYKRTKFNLLKKKGGEIESSPFMDKLVNVVYICQICGEQVAASKKPEWAIKAKHSLLHVGHELKYSCVYCSFACFHPGHFFKHMSLAHNNKTDTHLYPIFTNQSAADKFDECVSSSFPGTSCRSMLNEDVDFTEILPPNTAYYFLELGRPKVTSFPQLSLSNSTIEENLPSTSNVAKPELKSLNCTECNFKAPDVKSMADHLRDIHNLTTIPVKSVVQSIEISPSSQLLSCKLCEFSTMSVQKMIVHLQSAACSGNTQKEKNIKCSFCDLIFTSSHLLEDHILLAHTSQLEKSFSCSQCDYKAVNAIFLQDHIKMVHFE